MTPGNAGHGTHREIWDLLPWYVTACLADRERERVEAHVKACAECRVELAQQRQLHRAMDVDSAVEHMPARSLQKLQQRLDAATVTVSADAGAPAPGAAARRPAWLGGVRLERVQSVRSMRSGALAAAAAAAVAAGVVLTAFWAPLLRDVRPAGYHTVTAPPARAPGVAIRAVFSPAITLSELQGILDDANLRIVSGPSEAGVYSLAITTARPVDESLRRLRTHAAVRFAESAGPQAAAAPQTWSSGP
jgi:hypothetical protein